MTNFNQRFITEVLPVTLMAAVALAFFGLVAYTQTETALAQTMCTMDARQCPDGSWVGRSGPNCEFVCGGDTSDNDGTYTNWPGIEYPGTYEVIPVPQPGGIAGSPGVVVGSDGYVPDYVDPQVMEDIMNAEANDYGWGQMGVTNDGSAMYVEEGVYVDNSAEYNDGTYTNWPGTEYPGGPSEDASNDGTYTNWPGTEHPGEPAENTSFGGTVFYSIGNFFSGVFDWFGW